MRIFFVLLFFATSLVYAQKIPRVNTVMIDTIVVTSNSFVILSDTVFFAEHDTVIYVVDTIRSNSEAIGKEDRRHQDSVFYYNLKRKMSQRKISRQLFNALFDLKRGKKKKSSPKVRLTGGLTPYEGRTIGTIHLKKVDVFGPSVTDTTQQANNRLSRFYNSIHIHTHDRVLYNQLLLKEGDVLTYTQLAESERIIRTLPFIRDARLVVKPRSSRSDTVDLLLITEDVIPYSFDAQPRGWISGSLTVDNNNILGTGHEWQSTLVVESRYAQTSGYEGKYHVPNIRGSFVEATLRYTDTHFEDVFLGSIHRPFYVPNIRYAGGAEISYQRLTTFSPEINSYAVLDTFANKLDIPLIRYGVRQQDYWLAQSFSSEAFDDRTRLSVGLRHYQQYFYERPEVNATENTAFHHRRQFLGSIAFSKRYYTTEKLVYTYGRTEDIPVGQLAELVVGPEIGEYANRWFTGLSYSRGNYLTPLGYVSAGVRGGGFWRNRRVEDGLFQFNIQSYSYLFYARRTRYRFFLNADYTRGVRRLPTINFSDRYVSVRREQGVRGLSNNALEGNERLAFSVEGVSYLPASFYSFQLAVFGFIDTGFIAMEGESVFSNYPYFGIGTGLRVRNENLAFKTFQVRVVVYPNAPDGASWFAISAGGIPLPRFRDFMMSKPQVFRFE